MKTNVNQSKKQVRDAGTSRFGFSLVEVLAIVAGILIVVAGGILTFGNARKSLSQTNLLSHTKQLNSALALYQSNSGQILSGDSVETILVKLKASSTGDNWKELVGMRGRMIDSRLQMVLQSSAEAGSNQPRVVWNGSTKRFEVRYGGNAGNKEFKLNDSAIPSASVLAVNRGRDVRLKLAKNSGWVWDNQTVDRSSSGGPTQFQQSSIADFSPDFFTASGGATAASKLEQLEGPLYSLAGGEFDYRDFNLDVTLTNPNQNGSSSVFHAINDGEWMDYAPGLDGEQMGG